MQATTHTHPIANRAEEQQLLHRLAAGETRAFWQLFQQCRDYLFRCCLKWTNGNSTEAEDLLSQAMLKALEKAQKYAEKIENFKSWLTTLTRNFWLDLKRRPCANQVEDIEVYAEQQEVGLVAVDDTPGSALERDDKNRVIRAAIDELPTKMGETFILHFYEELSHQEISEKQNISYQNVCKRISQARAILALELRGYFIGEDETKTELAVTLVVTESAIEEISEGNAEVEAIAGEPVTLSVAIAEVESVVGKESPFVAVSVGDSDSDSVGATSGGRLEEFNFMGKQIVGAFLPWLSSFGGSQLFHGLRKLVLEVRGEWCRWCGARMSAGEESCGRICACVIVPLSSFPLELFRPCSYLGSTTICDEHLKITFIDDKPGDGAMKLKIKITRLVCWICTMLFLLSILIGNAYPARADVEAASSAVVEKLKLGHDPYTDLCKDKDYKISGNKMYCQMASPYQCSAIIGCKKNDENCQGEEQDSLLGEYTNMKKLAEKNVRAARVGSEFINDMPCEDEQNEGKCGAFVEQWLEGDEIKLSVIEDEVKKNLLDDDCQKNYDEVKKVMQTVIENGQTWEAMIIAGLEDNQAVAFSEDMGRISVFGKEIGKIWDLQGFLQQNGEFFVIDPMAVTGIPDGEKLCFHNWTCALGSVVAKAHGKNIPKCNS